MYGSEHSSIFTAGLGTQTGYNIELGEGNFILQPIWAMNYSLINTFAYTNAAGVKIDPKALNSVQLNPMLRFVGNLNGWQPYASVGMVWNLMGKTDVMADTVNLPEISIKPYLSYNVGVQKAINDNFTGFVQVMGYNGGRDGINIVGGLRWAFGKGSKNYEAIEGNNLTENFADIQSIQEPLPEKPVQKVQNINAEQENIKAEESASDIQEIVQKQQDNKVEELVVNTQEIDIAQKDTQAEETITTTKNIVEERKDTKAEETVTNAPANEDEQIDIQSEEPASDTQDNNNLAVALAVAAVLILIIFALRRKK
jgi:hypothetical protein